MSSDDDGDIEYLQSLGKMNRSAAVSLLPILLLFCFKKLA